MSLKELVSKSQLVSCSSDTNIKEIAKMMEEKDVGSVLIMENNKPAGVITDRDIVIRCISKHDKTNNCVAKDFMSSPVESIPADAGIHDAISLMKEKEVRRIVVTDNNGTPCGLVSHGDVLKLVAREMSELAEGTAPKEEKLIGQEKAA